MKLATYKDGSRDGQLVVVSRDLATAHYATGIAERMQQLLDDWNFISPQLQDLYDALNRGGDGSSGTGKTRHAFPFDPAMCMAPLPRAYQWVDGSAYLNHVELVRLARHAPVPANYYTEPLMYQGGSDDFLGPCQDAPFASETWGIDFEAEVACITGDLPMQCSPERALDGLRLVMLANDWSLRHLVADELAKNFGFLQSKPATAFSPVAVTLDEFAALGAPVAVGAADNDAANRESNSAWNAGRLSVTVQSQWNGRTVGLCDAASDMTFHFGQLIAHLCKTRNVRAGSIIGSGTVSNKGVEVTVDGSVKKDWPKGYSCIAEKRAIETILDGAPKTDYMKFGDTIRIEAKGRDGQSVFGAIDQKVVSLP